MHCQTENDENDDIAVDKVEYLMQNPISLNVNGVKDITRLHLFAMHGHHRLMKHFIDKGCSVNVRTSKGETPLDMAIKFRNFDIAEILLRANAELPTSKASIKSAFNTILTNISKVPQYVYKRFYEAIKSTTSLMDIIASIEKSQCPLKVIVGMEDAELTKAIIEKRSKINWIESNNCIDVSVSLLNVANIEVLIHHGPDREQRVYRFFHWIRKLALDETGKLEKLRVLVESMPNWLIWNAHTAKCIGNIFEEVDESTLRMFLQNNIHWYIQKWLGIDVLAHCFGNADPGVMNLMRQFVEQEYSPKLGSGDKSTLHFAMKGCIYENIVFLQNRTNVSSNYPDAMGRTPLFEVFNSDEDIVKKQDCVSRLLVSYGADVQILDKYGKNLLDYYRKDADWKVIQLILNHLAMFESQGQSIHKSIRQKINSTQLFADYYKMCQEQLEATKKTRICLDANTFMMPDYHKSLKSLKFETLKLLSDSSHLSKFNVYFLIILNLQVMNLNWIISSKDKSKDNPYSLLCEGWTHLHLAAKHNNKVLTKHLIDEGFCVDVETLTGTTPLLIAMRRSRFELAEILLRAGAKIPLSHNQLIEKIFRSILTNTSQFSQYICKRFYEAMKSIKPFEKIVALIKKIKCPLPAIIGMQDAELTRVILQRRPEIDEAESFESMDVAVELLDVPNIEVLLHYGEDRMHRVDRFFNHLKEKALSGRDSLQALTVLIEIMPNWDVWYEAAVDSIGDTFEQAEEDVLEIFLQHEIHLHVKNLLNVDVVAHSFGNANPGVADLILKLVADGYSIGLGRGEKCGLHFAMKACIIQNITCHWKNASCNLRDAMGRTPLFEVFNSDQDVDKKRECVIPLLFFAADVQILDKSGMSLLDFYRTNDDAMVIKPMLAHLAMLESLGDAIDERIRTRIDSAKIFADYYKVCQQQLEDMKKTRLCLGVTSYTILTMYIHELEQSVRSEPLKLLKDSSYLKKFNTYYQCRLMLNVNHIEMINRGKDNLSSILCECCKILAPYTLIVDKIMSLLSSEYVISFDCNFN